MQAKKIISKIVGGVVNSVSQTSNKNTEEDYPISQKISDICRLAAAEGAVLLKNNGVLPLKKEERVSVFGRVQSDCFYVGYGSGGDVNEPYKVNFIEAFKNSGVNINRKLLKKYDEWREKNPVDNGFWGHWPMSYDEMPLDENTVKQAAEVSDAAIAFIGRAAGEDRENTLKKGSFYLTDNEDNMLRLISENFKKWAIILNIGGIFDFSWAEKYSPPAILILWLGGMEAGNACADLLTGKTNPSGVLTDTIAKNYDAYPSKDNFGGKKENIYAEDIFVGYRYFETFDKENVLFPFGFGLSYADFLISDISFSVGSESVNISAAVKNIGAVKGKKAVQLYVGSENTALCQPAIQLKAFVKTKELIPGEEQKVNFDIPYYDVSSYDDSGKTGNKSAYVLEKGIYTFYIGFSVRDAVIAGKFNADKTKIIKRLTEISAVQPEKAFMRLCARFLQGRYYKIFEPAPLRTNSLKETILKNLPKGMKMTEELNYSLSDIENGAISSEELVATLNYTELEAISRGDYIMNSPLGPKGNAGVFGGVLKSLRDKGLPPIVCADGPSGIRLAAKSALLPCATALACTFNVDLVASLYSLLGEAMRERGSDVLLAPGMNIHRNPLCGRNFEYFSEDPVVSGLIAAAVVSGLQKAGVSACPKHFVCNNQETNRTRNNSIVSERALREIYLKGFEICVKKARPLCIMTSYNKVNGVWSHYNYDLATSVLRGEWGYEGLVMTDWWMRPAASPEFPKIRNQAYRLRAQVDVLMPGGKRTGKRKPDGTLIAALKKSGGITAAELQRTALNVVRMILRLKALRK